MLFYGSEAAVKFPEVWANIFWICSPKSISNKRFVEHQKAPSSWKLSKLLPQQHAQVTALENAASVVQAAPNAATTQVVFADSPQTIGVDAIIDYLKKLGKDVYEKRCSALDDKALTDEFNMTPNETVLFVEAFKQKA